MRKSFVNIGIVGFKGKSADLACALDQITLWAIAHPKVVNPQRGIGKILLKAHILSLQFKAATQCGNQ